MATPEGNSINISHLITALGASIAMILSLVGIIYHNFKKTQEDQQGQLNDGVEEFTVHLVALEKLKKDVESIREWLIAAERIIKDMELKQLKDHETLLKIKVMHKHQHNEDIE